MPGRLENKIAIVTGASAGIGRAICLAFHREGATVVCSSISENTRNEAFREEFTTHDLIVKEGGKAIFVKADVGKSEDMQALVKKTVETYGRLDIMVNNAGINFESHDRVPVPVWEVSEERWNKTMSINLNGTFLGCKYAMAQMVQQEPHTNGDRGWVINVSSMLGKVGAAYAASYTTSKHAIMGLTKTAALEGAPHRVHVNALCPGFVETAFIADIKQNPGVSSSLESLHPFKGFGQPEDVAKAAIFLASDDSSWVTAIGLTVDGGYTAQ
ncbi:hypothetical protein EYB25_004722 [Talaromyces marneffei]|uniref:uncharacterized protein n=1 Tax=Talaromyces marneffei TaxID=37727 RepID=UPI0012A9F7F7|nr:uncharacterized protein EYB26_004200 [Talaromyces marneffei]KAE8553340.1 hypothetical protein EYB25_004722 [Talaromyces marneffei]QGA16533.1 hypothetical protein EYB26_004200 [Talaromyces marneffei]